MNRPQAALEQHAEAKAKPEPEKTQAEPEKTQADQLYDFYQQRLGSDWRKQVTLTLRADLLYWFVFLAERGMAERLQHFKKQPGGFGACEAASLGSWGCDIEELVEQIQASLKADQCVVKLHPGTAKTSSRCVLPAGHSGPHKS